MFVQNTSEDQLFVSWFEAFQPGEKREVSEDQAKELLANPNFIEVNTSKTVEATETFEPKKPQATKRK